ncbi:MAG: diadenylate cyclase [Actinomycetota bacterium]|nr:diadenylate cyclase [Actinomycetota bacterium]
MELHQEARRRAGEPWAPLDEDLTRMIGQHTVRRVISVLKDSRHGGMVVFIPPELTEEFSGENRYVAFKHVFAGGKPRQRFRTTIVGIMNRLAQIHGKGEAPSYPRAVGWEEYQKTNDESIAELDEAIFELAHLIAALASVDGAVVMSKRFELLGFGGEISGALPAVRTVLRTLDLEGKRTAEQSTDGVGTRHRSAYRLCNVLPEAVAVVVSQDGNVRFVKRTDGGVACWDHA